LGLDFGHFRLDVNAVVVFIRFQPVFLPHQPELGTPFSEKSPDTTCLVELAKVQFCKMGLKRQKAVTLSKRIPAFRWATVNRIPD
jgi:hypothetical protein